MLVSITEYSEMARDINGHTMPLGMGGGRTMQFRADGDVGKTSPGTRLVRIATDTPCTIGIKQNPVDTHQLFMPGVEYIATQGGKDFVISAV